MKATITPTAESIASVLKHQERRPEQNKTSGFGFSYVEKLLAGIPHTTTQESIIDWAEVHGFQVDIQDHKGRSSPRDTPTDATEPVLLRPLDEQDYMSFGGATTSAMIAEFDDGTDAVTLILDGSKIELHPSPNYNGDPLDDAFTPGSSDDHDEPQVWACYSRSPRVAAALAQDIVDQLNANPHDFSLAYLQGTVFGAFDFSRIV